MFAANFRYNFNTKVHREDFILILFLKVNQLIPPAKYDGTVLKLTMVMVGYKTFFMRWHEDESMP
jgi:hypothetical protein